MKRCLSVLLCVGLIVCMAAVSFASIDFRDAYYSDKSFLVDQGDGNTLLGVLDTASLGEAEKDYMRDYFAVMTGDKASSDSFVVLFRVHGNGSAVLAFIRSDGQLNLDYDSSKAQVLITSSPGSSYWTPDFEYKISTGDYRCASLLRFSPKSNSVVTTMNTVLGGAYPPSESLIAGGILWRSGDVSASFDLDELDAFYDGSIGFVDNDGLFSGDPSDPSSSEPPSSSAPPVIPDFPKIDSPYVPYDTSAWNDFIPFVLDYIKKAATVGLFILAIWSGIVLIKKVVKMFLHWGKL